jgi:type I site-specific restriction-modification system R (restriction) subunit
MATKKAAAQKKKSKNPEAEEKIRGVREFLDNFYTFYQMVKKVYKDAEAVPTREDEENFLKLKSHLARKHQILLESLGKDYISGERITPILSSTVTLRNIKTFHEDFYRKVEKQWHTVYLHLYETLGQLRHKLEQA